MNLKCTLPLLLFLSLLLPAFAGGQREETVQVAFHIETTRGDNPKMMFPHFVAGEERPFRRVPVISTKDVANFIPFRSESGQGYGVVLGLKPGSRNRLAATTASNIGRWMIARVNGRIVDAVVIDQSLRDGQLVIWKGIGDAEIQAMGESFPNREQASAGR